MRLGRRNKQPVGRQRVRPEPVERPVATPLSYGSGRRRNLSEQAEEAAEQAKASTSSKRSKKAKAAGAYWLQRVGLVVLLIAVLASVINVLTLSSNPKITILGEDGGSLLQPTDVYQKAATEYLADSALNKNKITIDASEVSRRMEAAFPELADVSVTVPLLAHRPVVYIEPTQPGLILQASNGIFLIDTRGKAVLKGGSIGDFGSQDTPVVTDMSGLEVARNKSALPAEDVSFIQEIQTQLAAKQFKITSITLPPAASQIDVALEGQPYIVKFNLQSDTARQQAGTFLATINRLQQDKVTPAQYVDVRVNGRAYYQ